MKTEVELRMESGPHNLSIAIRQVQKEWDAWCDDYVAMQDRERALAAELATTRRVLSDDLKTAGNRVKALEAALRTANDDLKAVWIETGKGLEGLKRTEVALGLTAETKPAPGFCSECLMTGGHKLSCSGAETDSKHE
jgi:hypothetical protein